MAPDPLPQDVGRLIFEIAAESPDLGARCSVVSKEIKSWVEPILYKNITLSSVGQTARLLRTIQDPTSTKSTDFYAQHVKSIFSEVVEEHGLVNILKVCTGVKHLSYWPDLERLVSIQVGPLGALFECDPLPISPPTSLLLVGPIFLAKKSFSLPVFRDVTHLEVNVNTMLHDFQEAWDWSSFSEMLNLTHFGLDCADAARDDPSFEPSKAAGHVLERAPASLKLFLIYYGYHITMLSLVPGHLQRLHDGSLDDRVVLAFQTPNPLKDIGNYGVPYFMPYLLVVSKVHKRQDLACAATSRARHWEKGEEIQRRRRLERSGMETNDANENSSP